MAGTNVTTATADLNALEDRRDAAFAKILADEQAQLALIERLQSTPGTFTPVDQALVDQLESRIRASVTAMEEVAAWEPPVEPPPIP